MTSLAFSLFVDDILVGEGWAWAARLEAAPFQSYLSDV